VKPEIEPPALDANADIPALIETLLATEQRLEELTRGEVDTVPGQDGRMFLLRRAREELRFSEAARQASILDALPARIALLDPQGMILSVNESWRQFAIANVFHATGHGVGLNYVEICAQARGDCSFDAHQIATGIRAVLSGAVKDATGGYTLGLVGCALVFVVGMLALLQLGTQWSTRWAPAARQQAGVYSYKQFLRPAPDLSYQEPD
jgi:PAS domain-containing protein